MSATCQPLARHARRPHPARRLALAAGLAAGSVLGTGTPVAAHVEPEVSEVPAGTEATVAFTVEHGCDGSPTVKLELQAPAGITGLAGEEKAGWDWSVDGSVLTYTGGPLADAVQEAFPVRFTAPAELGTVRFKMIQTCETGSIDWIQEDEDADRPAPAVEIVAPPPGATVVPTQPTTTTTGAPTTTTTGPVATTTTTATAGDGTARDDTDASEDEDEDGSSPAPWVAAGVVLLGVLGGGAYAWRRRSA